LKFVRALVFLPLLVVATVAMCVVGALVGPTGED